MIVFALALNIARTEDRSDDLVDHSAAAIELPADSWTMLAELVGEIDIETASAAGVIEPGSAERAVLQLTAEERQELTRLLRAELTRAKS